METPDTVEPVAMQELPGGSGPGQAGAGWLPGHADRESTLSEELSSLDVLCDMEAELEAAFVELLGPLLRSLPLGPPALLAFRAESARGHPETPCPLSPPALQPEEECAPRCEYCGSLLRPFPLSENTSQEDYGSKFCCERNRELYEFILEQRRKQEDARRALAAVSAQGAQRARRAQGAQEAQGAQGPTADKKLSKEKASHRQQERPTAKPLPAFPAAEPKSVAKCPNSPGTISYVLSQEPPAPGGRTLPPGASTAGPAEEPESPGITCCDFSPRAAQAVKNELLEKYYKHGGKFLTMLPDGTSQLFYPSGNLAIIVVREKHHLACIVQADKASEAEIQAVFLSSGSSTCYHPHGSVWINMNIQGGQYLDQAGSRVRRWTWPNSLTSPGPHVPLSPIFISLNQYVGVRILGQDKITVSFLAMGQQAKFNVGTKVQVSEVSRLLPPARPGEDELLLLALRVRILWLFDRLRGCLSFPSNEQRDKIKPPGYLTRLTLKILQLCTSSDISDELHSWVRVIVNAPV